jgi:hypothetical protein
MQKIFGVLICSIMWLICQGSPLFSLWETNCKIHADSKHEEMKGIIKDHYNFNSNNWSHSILVVITIMISCVLLVGACFVCYKFSPFCLFANKLRNFNQLDPQKYQHQQFNPPYNVTPFTGRALQFREIHPTTLVNQNNWKFYLHLSQMNQTIKFAKQNELVFQFIFSLLAFRFLYTLVNETLSIIISTLKISTRCRYLSVAHSSFFFRYP